MAVTVRFDPQNMFNNDQAERSRIETEVMNYRRTPTRAVSAVVRYGQKLPPYLFPPLMQHTGTGLIPAGATAGFTHGRFL
jgi:hypothetical protein